MINSIDFIHVGYHKTGTTYLQNCGFQGKSDIRLLGGYSSNNNDQEKSLYLLKCKLSELGGDVFCAEKWREDFFSIINSIENLEGKILGVSDEALSGNYITGEGDFEIAERIHKVFGKVKVVIVIRNQIDMIDSIYRQYIHLGGVYSFKKFIRSEGQNITSKLKYDKLIGKYIELFGKDNVLILPYENIKNKSFFLSNVYKFIQINNLELPVCHESVHNRSHHYYTLFFDRIINFLFRDEYSEPLFGRWFFKQYISLPIYKKGSGFFWKREPIGWWYRRVFVEKIIDPFIMYRFFTNHKTLDKKTQVLLRSQFIDTNKSIERMFNLNLKKLGYPVS